MVTAGVYLVARCYPLFGLVPGVLLLVGVIGTIPALLAALIAITQTDLKRVMAYSTLSQLGFMFLALGSGVTHDGHYLAGFAVAAAIFHLFTHAFFKALLFLASGSVMHAMGDVIDMRRFSGLRKVLPVTHWTFLCGAGALSGFPVIFSGFWSKDEILAAAYGASQHSEFRAAYLLLFLVGMTTAFITAFYTARAYFLTFWGELRIPPEAFTHHHAAHDTQHAHAHHGPAHDIHAPHAGTPSGTDAEAQAHVPRDQPPGEVHDASPIMAWPLMILAAGAVLVGIALGPTGLFEGFLEQHWVEPGFPRAISPAEPAHHAFNWLLMLVSSLVALGGIGLAYLMYVRQPSLASEAAHRMAMLYEASRNRFYLDELYYSFIVAPLDVLAQVLRVFDQYVVDGLVDLIGQLPAFIGYVFRPIQNGLVQFYALLMVLGVAGFLLSVLLR
jgi:NADH-quinone oxidoreductase subunit L